MAITKLLHIKERASGNPAAGLEAAITYISNPAKTQNGRLMGSLNCTFQNAYKKMIATKKIYGKEDGRQGYHYIISFNPGEVTPDKALQITDEFCRRYFGTDYEAVFSVHDDKEHIHSHIVFNSVSIADGHKYRYEKGDWKKNIQPLVNSICSKYGLEEINVNETGIDGINYGEWEGNKKGTAPTNRDELRSLIDQLIPKVQSLDGLVEKLKESGCEIRVGKYVSIKLPSAEKSIRTYRLGFAYEKENLIKRIGGDPILLPYSNMPANNPAEYKIVRAGFREAGKKSAYKSDYWKYKDSINRVQKINRQNRYLIEHGIRSEQQLRSRLSMIESQMDEIDAARKQIFKQRRTYQDLIEIIKTNPEQQAKEMISEMGMDADSVFYFEKESRAQLDAYKAQKRKLYKERDLVKSIEASYKKEIRR